MESKNDFKKFGKVCSTQQNIQLPQLEHSMLCRRRTSAEMINEAKTFLSDVGQTANSKTPNPAASGITLKKFFRKLH